MSEVFEQASVSLILADFAVADQLGKLQMVGGGLQLIGRDHNTGVSAAFALVVSLTFPPELFNEQYAFEVVLEDETGNPMELAESSGGPRIQGDALRSDPADRGTQLPRQRGARAGPCPPDRTWCCTSTPACRCPPGRCWSGGPESTASPVRNGPSRSSSPPRHPLPSWVDPMRIATWNINSIRARLDRLTAWLARSDVDVLAIQETKIAGRASSRSNAFADLGYQVAHHGTNQWNGVAVLSRVGLDDVQVGVPGLPTFGDPAVTEARAISAVLRGRAGVEPVRPERPGDRRPALRLQARSGWRRCATTARRQLADDPHAQIAFCGDFNIAPTDDDIWSVDYYRGSDPRHPAGAAGVRQPGRRRIRRRGPPVHLPVPASTPTGTTPS